MRKVGALLIGYAWEKLVLYLYGTHGKIWCFIGKVNIGKVGALLIVYAWKKLVLY